MTTLDQNKLQEGGASISLVSNKLTNFFKKIPEFSFKKYTSQNLPLKTSTKDKFLVTKPIKPILKLKPEPKPEPIAEFSSKLPRHNLTKSMISLEPFNKNAIPKTSSQNAVIKPTLTSQPNLSPVTFIPISTKIQGSLASSMRKWKSKNMLFKHESHEQYCKTKNVEDLPTPISNITIRLTFPITICQDILNTFNSYLSKEENNKLGEILVSTPKLTFTTKLSSNLVLSFNNYTMHNFLYKGTNFESIRSFETLIDFEWLTETNTFISNLSTKDATTISSYTIFGNVFVNRFISGLLPKEIFLKEIQSSSLWTNFFPLYFQCIETIKNLHKTIETFLVCNINIKPYKKAVLDRNANFFIEKKDYTLSFILTSIASSTFNDKETYKHMKYIVKYFKYEFWENVLYLYADDLQSILSKAPLLRKKMIVYRGVKDDSFLKSKSNHIYKPNGFVSTTFSLQNALSIIENNNENEQCCLKRFTLLPGSRALFLYGLSPKPNEFEVLLGRETQMYLTKEKSFIPKDAANLCHRRKVAVTDVVVIK